MVGNRSRKPGTVRPVGFDSSALRQRKVAGEAKRARLLIGAGKPTSVRIAHLPLSGCVAQRQRHPAQNGHRCQFDSDRIHRGT